MRQYQRQLCKSTLPQQNLPFGAMFSKGVYDPKRIFRYKIKGNIFQYPHIKRQIGLRQVYSKTRISLRADFLRKKGQFVYSPRLGPTGIAIVRLTTYEVDSDLLLGLGKLIDVADISLSCR